jgi:hypothetical protein
LGILEEVNQIPANLRSSMVDRLIDLILTSPNASKLTGNQARALLQQSKTDKLTTDSGLAILLDSAILLEPLKTSDSLNALGLTNLASRLKSMGR